MPPPDNSGPGRGGGNWIWRDWKDYAGNCGDNGIADDNNDDIADGDDVDSDDDDGCGDWWDYADYDGSNGNWRSLIKVKFSTDQFRPALGSGCRLSIDCYHAQKTSKLPYFRLF